ncbi:MAG: type VI secretion system tip protein VgrG, partial [Burkholderiales bacterium]|nr:type VI secretion system tip protein VgrG [Burkholderiales bacterium]
MNVPLPGGLSSLGAELVSRLKASLSIGQSTRLIQIETALPSGILVVERFTLAEGLHADEPMWAEVDCLSTNAHLELKSLIGEQVTLRLMQANSTWRNWHGYVVQAGQMGSDGGLGSYRLQLAAFTHWLKQRRDTRIFQDATSTDIVSAVLSAYPQARFKFDVADPGPVHEITTQHREADWAFVTRLMAREGWSWHIDHDGDAQGAIAGPRAAKHTLVIFDHNAKRPDLGALRFSRPDIRGAGPGGLAAAIAQAFNLSTGLAQDTITAWSAGQQVGTNTVTLAAWDERQLAGVSAQTSLMGRADIALGNVPTLEHYSGHGERCFADGRVGTAQPASSKTADARVQAMMAAHQLGQVLTSGQSAVRALSPGITFQITEHSRYPQGMGADADNAFCAVSISHEAANNLGHQAAQILQRTDIEQGSYRNRFQAAPATARLAPQPRNGPTAPGPQTAVVMAAKGEPLSTDRNHRIRIQFGWQRGIAPLAGALTAPQTPGGADTGHAPGNEQSGTWV